MVERPQPSPVTIEVSGLGAIDALEPLWLTLFDHHRAVGPGPFIDRSDSWPARRRLYAQVLAEPDAFVAVARRVEEPVGYALVAVHEGPDDTWPTGDRFAEVETLAVVPAERGQGIGTRLLDTVDDRLEQLGIATLFIAVMEGNDDAMRFYRRRGFRPSITKLMRLGAIPPDQQERGGSSTDDEPTPHTS